MSDKMTDRISKLFTRAEATSGTPESDACLEKAYALLAKHGIDETLARSGGDLNASEVITVRIPIRGKYLLDQVALVGAVARPLHCDVLRFADRDDYHCIVVGARRHVDRVTMLVGFLQGLMLARASRTRPTVPGVSTSAHRRSFMCGFAAEVEDRLEAAENSAVNDSGDASGAAIVLASDADRAAAEMRRQFPRARRGRSRRIAQSGIDEGRAAAADVDFGQTRVNARLALSA